MYTLDVTRQMQDVSAIDKIDSILQDNNCMTRKKGMCIHGVKGKKSFIIYPLSGYWICGESTGMGIESLIDELC